MAPYARDAGLGTGDVLWFIGELLLVLSRRVMHNKLNKEQIQLAFFLPMIPFLSIFSMCYSEFLLPIR